VRVVAREVSPELGALGVEIKRVDLRVYDPSPDIQWADVVVIAVSDVELAERLFKLAEEMGKLVNDATDASRTHVVVPYEREVAGLRIAVTSEGAAGTPARLSLDVIEECIKRSWIPAFYVVYSVLKKGGQGLDPRRQAEAPLLPATGRRRGLHVSRQERRLGGGACEGAGAPRRPLQRA
jgi:precorrin-2 dehydrogenase/sirohydrochlorin ferrochelatase